MVLAFLVMRVAGSQKGGIFAFGYSTVGQQMFLLAYFGVRSFQITDTRQEYLFGDYLHFRYLTCTVALLFGCAYVLFNRYDLEKTMVIFLLIGYKVIDGFADVYETEFQRIGRLYLTGKSNTFRTILERWRLLCRSCADAREKSSARMYDGTFGSACRAVCI